MKTLLTLLLAMSLLPTAQAFSWQDLWATPDQQAQKMMNKGQFAKAKDTFERQDWRAASAYRVGDYEQAAKDYQSFKSEDAYYNRGNALAHMGQYEQALKAYDQALGINPDNQDALHNRKIIEDLLKKDKQQQQQNQDKQSQDKQNHDKQSQDKQNQDKQNQDKQNQDKQNQDKQNNKSEGSDSSQAAKEEQQAKDQWLKLIPDDPGGLMREKFLRDHIRRQRGWD